MIRKRLNKKDDEGDIHKGCKKSLQLFNGIGNDVEYVNDSIGKGI